MHCEHAVVCDGVLGGVEGLECCFPDPLPGQAVVGGLVPESLPGDFRPAPVVEEFVTIYTTCRREVQPWEFLLRRTEMFESIRGARYGSGGVCCVRNVWWGRGRGRAILYCLR